VLRKIADERGVSVAEVSINWVLAQPGVTTALLGSTNPKNVAKNIKAADWDLTEDELAFIESNYKRIMG
jgi:aryl-alcohol dehydrogenase-like predicted oxidoreductase